MDNVLLDNSSDPWLIKDYLHQVNDPGLAVPVHFEVDFRHFMGTEPRGGQLPTRINGPEDYQAVFGLIQRTQGMLDTIGDRQLLLYGLRSRWREILGDATKYLNLRYYNVIEGQKTETAKKVLINTALHPLIQGIIKIESLCEQADKCYGHLASVMFNLKDSAKIVDQYLATLRYGSGPGRRDV